jgi:hypothetical protein
MLRAFFWGVLCTLLALPALADGRAPADDYFISELKAGAQVHDMPYMWSGFHVEPYTVDLNVEALFGRGWRVWGGNLRPALGATVNFNGDTSKAYLDARWERDFAYRNMFLGLGLGIAVHNGETFTSDPHAKELGRRVLFHPNIEIGQRLDEHRSLSLYFEHISNASTADKNQGLDTLGIRYGYRF